MTARTSLLPDGAVPRLAIVRAAYTPFGGAERFVERALQALADRGIQTTVICASWTGALRPGGAAQVIELGRARAFTRQGRDRAFERAVQGVLVRERFDIVQTHERLPGLPVFRAGDGLHRSWLAAKARVQSPWAARLTSWDPYHRFVLAQEEALFTHPALRAVIANSAMVRDEILGHWPFLTDRVHVIRNGVDVQAFSPPTPAQRQATRERLGLPAQAPVFAFVGSGFLRKGVGMLIELARRIREAHVLVVGDDKERERYEQQAAPLGGRVRFVGAQRDVRPWLTAAQAFVFPTLYDPGPNAVLEAMAMGLPVLTTKSCGLAEVLLPTGAGLAHDALDADALEASLRMLCQPDLAALMGEAARAAACAQDTDTMGRELLALYLRLLRRDSGHSTAMDALTTLD